MCETLFWNAEVHERRSDKSEVTREKEDLGLFKSELVEVGLELSADVKTNRRGDLLVQGFVAGRPVDVLFAGRRKRDAVQLEAFLDYVRTRVSQPNAQRMQIRVQGSWRPSFHRNGEGEDDRRMELVAARWMYRLPDGSQQVWGQPPVTKYVP